MEIPHNTTVQYATRGGETNQNSDSWKPLSSLSPLWQRSFPSPCLSGPAQKCLQEMGSSTKGITNDQSLNEPSSPGWGQGHKEWWRWQAHYTSQGIAPLPRCCNLAQFLMPLFASVTWSSNYNSSSSRCYYCCFTFLHISLQYHHVSNLIPTRDLTQSLLRYQCYQCCQCLSRAVEFISEKTDQDQDQEGIYI